MKTPFLLAALAAASLPVAGRAATAPTSADASTTVSISVSVADLALDRSAGAGVALDRIRTAARTVCGERPSPFDLAQVERRRACIRRATEDAVRDLGAPLVTARYYRPEPVRLLAAR